MDNGREKLKFNYQLSIINYQLSIINYQLSIINYQLLWILRKILRK
jgi:hypothetical protein